MTSVFIQIFRLFYVQYQQRSDIRFKAVIQTEKIGQQVSIDVKI